MKSPNRRHSPFLTALFVGMALALSGPTAFAGQGGRPAPNSDGVDVPNYPDRNGCVRLCEFDLNPCDPPIDKKLDGRCTRKD